ncbi:MAG: tRNA 2-thiouridine(34) synthase MnmA [Clostridiales bacterium]
MEKVLVAISGGVDSGVAVHLLQKAGYEVYGYTFLTCGDEKDRAIVAEDAAKVANFFGISHTVADIKEEFEDTVMTYFVHQYAAGLTPNPCVFCNETIKFPKLLAHADSLGIKKVATGHYVRVENGVLKKAADIRKDQSYVLCLLNKKDISRFMFPLGNYSKPEIRDIANEINLPVANKGDSQEICFIPNDDYRMVMRQFPHQYKEGAFLDSQGTELGKHQGLPFYTIGQRRGIGIAFGKPMYVTGLDTKKNAVILGDEKELYAQSLKVDGVNYLVDGLGSVEFRAEVKIRYLSNPVPATIKPQGNNSVEVIFDESQKSITPGQFAVFYDGDILLGGGTIL